MKSNFQFEKWYMDVVTENAEVLIGYFARLQWGKISLTYNGFIHRNEKGEVVSKNSFVKSNSPEWRGPHLDWNPSFLKGNWNMTEAPIRSELFRSEDQYIEWNCVMPKAAGKVVIGNTTIEGLSYAEKMTFNILPWQLPLRELFWGRFLSTDYSVIWIEWRGPQPKLWIWVNGKPHLTGAVSNEEIQTAGLRLTFETKFELRSGRISDTIFKGVQKIMSIFPRSIFQLHENKWCGVANLTLHDRQQIKGTYIHEQVIWQ